MNSLPQILELLAKSALILTAAALLAASWHRASAAQRHALWLAAFVTLLFLPLSKLTTPHWRLPGSTVAPTIITNAAPVVAAATIDTAAAIPAPAPVRAWRWPEPTRSLTGLWLAGVAALLAYRLLGSVQIARLRRRSTPLDETRVLALARTAAAELDLAHRYEIRHAAAARVPCTWGVRRPVILLPTAALQWNEMRLLAALRHEFGHIARRDYLTRWLGYIICALYWPNPLVWLAAHSLHRTQEQACDDLVLRAGTPATDYAALLFEAASASAQRGSLLRHAVAMARPSTLEGRVLAIVDETRNRRSAGRGSIALGTFVVTVAFGLSALAQVASEAPPQNTAAAPTEADQAPSTASEQLLEKTPAALPPQETETRAANAGGPQTSLPPSPGVMSYTDPASIILPKLDFREATLPECLDQLRKTSRELDPAGRGINFVLLRKPDAPDPKITISLQDIPLSEALKYIAALAEMEVVYEPHAIKLRPAAPPDLKATITEPFTLQSNAATIVKSGSGTLTLDPAIVGANGRKNAVSFDWPTKPAVTDIPIDIQADEVRFENGVAIATGDVTLKHGSNTITGEKLSYDPATKTIRTEGPSKTVIHDPSRPSAIAAKASAIIIPKFVLKDATLQQSVDALMEKSREFDPEKKGIAVTLAKELTTPAARGGFGLSPTDARITLSLTNIPVVEALRYLTGLAGTKFRFTDNAVLIVPLTSETAITPQTRPR